MIKFNLHGELGNQMFEWATGLSFAKNNNCHVEFNTLPGVVARIGEFVTSDNFTIRDSTALQHGPRLLQRAIGKLSTRYITRNIQSEIGLNFQELNFSEERTYHGYFQSWRYFHSIREDLISEFELKSPSKGYAGLVASLPKKFTGIHIRRGGSGAAILTSNYHGLLDADYYEQAIRLNIQLGGSQSYVIFTDNPERAQETIRKLGLNEYRVIGPKDTHSQCENLGLMTHATSFIGANSSYSWWAAYLNENLVTQPIFPRQWYMDPNLSNNDMLLPGWLSIGFEKFLNEEKTRGINIEK